MGAVGSLTLASRAPVCPAWVKVRLPHLKPSPSMRRLLGRRASPPEGVGLMDLPLVSNQLDFLDLWAAVAGTGPLFSTAAFHKVFFFSRPLPKDQYDELWTNFNHDSRRR